MFLQLSFGNITEPLTGRTWKREQVLHRVAQRRTYLAHMGMNQNDRVFVHYGNRIEFFIDLLSVWSLGACLVPVDPRLTVFEIQTLARAANPRFSIWHELPEDTVVTALASNGTQVLTTEEPRESLNVRSGYNCDDLRRSLLLDQDALILFTSGTTGSPKGVVHTHRSLRARWITLRQTLGVDAFKRTLCLLPTHFGHGLICNCLFPWLSGQDLFILPPFKNDVILQLGELLDSHEITFMSSVPPVWRLALKVASPPRAGKLKRVFCGSAPLSGHLWKGIKEWTGAPEVLNAYGITETASWLAGTTGSGFSAEDGLIGEAWGGIIKILDCSEGLSMFTDEKKANESGYVWVNTPALMRGYLDNDELTQKVVCQGWFFTGDIGLKDDRGLLYLRGREREEINKGGMKVYPGDVDAVVERFEEVLDVCTFAYEDPLLGENVGIAMVLKSKDDLTLKRLLDWTRLHLAQHQMPSRWYLLDEIPRTSRGKINREGIATTCKGVRPLDLRSRSGIVENNQGAQVNDH